MLRGMGCSQREMERNKTASCETSKVVFEAADRLGICWPPDDDITNTDLERLLFPDEYKNACLQVEPNYQYIYRYANKNNLTYHAPIIEIYQKGYGTTMAGNPEKYETDIYLPLRP